MSGDTTVGGSSSTPSKSGQQPPNPSQSSQPSQASSQGLPWGWIVIGIVAVVILIALATRGTGGIDRSVEKTEDHDDIRRVG